MGKLIKEMVERNKNNQNICIQYSKEEIDKDGRTIKETFYQYTGCNIQNTQIFQNFTNKVCVAPKMIIEHYNDLISLDKKITEEFSKFDNFDGVDIDEDYDHQGVRVRFKHKKCQGVYVLDYKITDFDVEKIVKEMLKDFAHIDTPEYIDEQNHIQYEMSMWGYD